MSDNNVIIDLSNNDVARLPEIVDLVDDSDNENEEKLPISYAQISVFELDDEEVQVVRTVKTALNSVLEVFPDVDSKHAEELLRSHNNKFEDVLGVLAEGNYPKSKNQDAGAATSTGISLNRSTPTYDFMSTTSFKPSQIYIQEAHRRLSLDFPFLKKDRILSILAACSNHYTPAYEKISQKLSGKNPNVKSSEIDEEKQYGILFDTVLSGKRRAYPAYQAAFGTDARKSKTRGTYERYKISDKILKEEISHLKTKQEDWKHVVGSRIQRKRSREVSLFEGSAIECSCCYEKVSLDEMVSCREDAHLFCVDCLKSYVENQVFGSGNFGINQKTKKRASELLCFHGDGCSSGFDRLYLEKALPKKTLEKYDELQSQLVLEEAGLQSNICECPKCGFKAEIPETQMVFSCMVADCLFQSCRKCGLEAHVPLRCDEVTADKQDKARQRVEEAVSAAFIRHCPTCKKGIIKSDGCNKMTCACGTKFCYTCRAKVSSYDHFCQVPHCKHKKCKKCSLYTTDQQDRDNEAMRNAATNEAAKVEAQDVNIDVDSILKGHSISVRRRRR